MNKSEAFIEVANLAASLIQLMRGHPGGASISSAGGSGSTGISRAIERIVTSLGFTKLDETALAGVIATLSIKEVEKWALILGKLSDEERKFLRIVIALMEKPSPQKVQVQKKEDEGEKEKTPEASTDIRLQFVRKLCALIPDAEEVGAQEKAAEDVANMLRQNNLVGAEHAFTRFRKIRGWLEQQIADMLGVQQLSDVSGELLQRKAQEWNRKLAEEPQAEPRGILERLVGLTILGPQTPAESNRNNRKK